MPNCSPDCDQLVILPAPERQVIEALYDCDMTPTEAATELGLSAGQVHQIHAAAVSRLRLRRSLSVESQVESRAAS